MKISELKEKIDHQIILFRNDLLAIRTGRVTPSLVENIKVDAYEGNPALTLRELSTISVTENNVIAIKPWDLTLIPKIEKAIRQSPGGYNPNVFDDLLRINIPPLSTERRQELARVVKSKAEAAKVEIRQIRHDEMRSIDEMEENGIISEDERYRVREEVELLVKEKTEEIEKIAKTKEEDLLAV